MISGSPHISVIIAAYNAQSSIERCLHSIFSQTIDGLDIIVIDDGSTDDTPVIVAELIKSDERTRFIRQTNAGVSAVREKGLMLAKGEYVIYVDADDWLEPDALSLMYNAAKAHSSDMLICDFWVHDSRGAVYDSQKPEQPATAENVFAQLLGKLHGSVCNKLIRREAFINNDVHFPPGVNWGEDLYVCLLLLSKGISVHHIPQALYHYDQTQNDQSLTSNWYEYPMPERMRVLRMIEPIVQDSNQGAFSTYVGNIAYDALFCKKEYCKDFNAVFGAYRETIAHSGIPRWKRTLIRLRYMGIRLPLRSLRILKHAFT